MNEMRLKLFDGVKVSYEYKPEGKGAWGLVTFNLLNGTSKIEITAENDTDTNRYANKALYKIEKLIEEKDLPIECIQAWG